MARRPRPAHKSTRSPTALHDDVTQSRAHAAKRARPKAVDFLSKSKSPEYARSTASRHPEPPEDDSESDGPKLVTDEGNVGSPRAAQWIDDDEFDLHAHADGNAPSPDSEGCDGDSEGDHSTGNAGPSRRLHSLQDDLSTLPLGTLRRAQRSLVQAHALGDTESDSDDSLSASDNNDVPPPSVKATDGEKPGQSSKSKKELVKRANKHAPTEITSKRPVSRKRVVVDDKFPKPRDPRFTHSAGHYDTSKFSHRYDFLSGMHKDELAALGEHVKRARKLVANSPAHLRAEREEEVDRLERAMKRAESAVNTDHRERVEREALHMAKRTEKEKRKKGKGGWWMKRSEQKQLLAKARLDAIAAAGGKQAVKKAVEKKQKKMNQKEKKMRPFPRGEGVELANGKKRRLVPGDSRDAKRRKVG